MKSYISSTPEMDPRKESQIESRIDELKQAYIEDEISEENFDTLLDAAFEDDAPFRADWFMRQPESRRKRYAEEDIYVYCGNEYKVEGDLVVSAEEDEIERVVNVTGGGTPDEDEIEVIEREDEPSDEAKDMQAKLKESLGLDS